MVVWQSFRQVWVRSDFRSDPTEGQKEGKRRKPNAGEDAVVIHTEETASGDRIQRFSRAQYVFFRYTHVRTRNNIFPVCSARVCFFPVFFPRSSSCTHTYCCWCCCCCCSGALLLVSLVDGNRGTSKSNSWDQYEDTPPYFTASSTTATATATATAAFSSPGVVKPVAGKFGSKKTN